MKTIILIGARIDGHASVVIDCLNLINKYKIIGFLDNSPEFKNKIISGIPVLGSSDDIDKFFDKADFFHISIGDNVSRGYLFNKLKSLNCNLLTIIHPNAIISDNTTIGEGSFIGPAAIINNNAKLMDCVIINSGAIIEHDNYIGSFTHIAPGSKTAGRVFVDDYSFVGIGSNIIPDIKIGKYVIVGAGSTVIKNIENRRKVVGFPARYLNSYYK